MDLTQVKHEIESLAEAHKDEFEAVSAYIFAHPELAYHEKLAQEQLCGMLEKHGFQVQRGAGSLDTAFVAEYRSDLKRDHGKIWDRRDFKGSWNTGGGKRKRKDHDAG